MSTKNLFRISAVAAIVSSGLSFLAAFVSIVALFVPGIPDLVVAGLVLVTELFILFALLGSYGVQTKEAQMLGLVGFILAVVGLPFTILLAPLGWLLFLVGICLFAIANMRADVLPDGGMWLWFAGALTAVPAGFLGLGILFALGLGIAACGRAWIGIALWALADQR